jgi:hypothetical protein
MKKSGSQHPDSSNKQTEFFKTDKHPTNIQNIHYKQTNNNNNNNSKTHEQEQNSPDSQIGTKHRKW